MESNFYSLIKVSNSEIKDTDSILLNIEAIKKDYNYLGLWYAYDGNEDVSLTTQLYSSNGEQNILPKDFYEEIKEAQFKNTKRYEIKNIDDKWIWICVKVHNENHCLIKTGSYKEGKLYINYKLIHNKHNSFSVIGSGVIKTSNAMFVPIYIEDNKSPIDYKDAIMYLVFIKNLPPEDWAVSHQSFGIEGLPLITEVAKFPDDKKYTLWNGQTPFKK
ncbi:MAG: hypothetical protein A2Y34_11695 [Spirochaetes bacterium GWC1_27_15]|nr:MAG: hypothetical protein A2Z98_12700 [Spirochaetes bacterium GWB1_27_13]OHD26665.1 MAG: hypothetical protein A2Y34_11695 [Spirochaetes bacterium GWC1_27_15]